MEYIADIWFIAHVAYVVYMLYWCTQLIEHNIMYIPYIDSIAKIHITHVVYVYNIYSISMTCICYCCMLFVGLLLFYVLSISKVISGQVPAFDSAHSWQLYNTSPLEDLFSQGHRLPRVHRIQPANKVADFWMDRFYLCLIINDSDIAYIKYKSGTSGYKHNNKGLWMGCKEKLYLT